MHIRAKLVFLFYLQNEIGPLNILKKPDTKRKKEYFEMCMFSPISHTLKITHTFKNSPVEFQIVPLIDVINV